FFFSSRRRHTRLQGDWSSDVCSSDLDAKKQGMDIGDLVKRLATTNLKHQEVLISIESVISKNDRRLFEQDEKRLQDLEKKVKERSEERRVGKECRTGWAQDN